MYNYEKGKLIIASDFEIREIRQEDSDIDLLIPLDQRTLNLNIDSMPDFIIDRFQFRDVRNIIIRFSTNEDNFCTIHLLRSIDIHSAIVNFVMDYSSHQIEIVERDFSAELNLSRK